MTSPYRLSAAAVALIMFVTQVHTDEVPFPGCPEIACMMECEGGFRKDANGCDICECLPLECSAMTCQSGMICEVFEVSGERVPSCVDPKLPTQCRLPMDRGVCDADTTEMRYFYAASWGDGCQEFLYSGCGGNENNFRTLGECQQTCSAESAECDDSTCYMECEFGFKKDANGCAICECRTEPEHCDPNRPFCFMACELGYKKDDNGCAICECQTEPEHCDDDRPTCRMHCEFGFKTDDTGCQVCECREEAAHCEPERPMCAMYCEHGFKHGEDGCFVCECRHEPSHCERPQDCMLAGCPYGRKQDEEGCSICECQVNPCHLAECPPDKMCHVKPTEHTAEAECRELAAEELYGQCPAYSCFMFCEHGFMTNHHGCEVCQCRMRPARTCHDVTCPPCEFGHAFDASGCKTCECLSDPCRDGGFDCGNGTVCEGIRTCEDKSCRARRQCISDVRRVHVEFWLTHEDLDDIDMDEIKSVILDRFHELSENGDLSVKQLKVKRLSDEKTLSVDFHVLGDTSDDLIASVRRYQEKITQQDSKAIVQYADTQFVPNHGTFAASYHSSEEIPAEDCDSDTDTIIIIACTVGGALLLALVIFIAVMVSKTKKSKKTNRNLEYSQAPTADDVTFHKMNPGVNA